MAEQYYYGHGKLLLTGEYFVLDGAKALALPTKLGQKMFVRYRPSSSPKLVWKSIDSNGKVWFEARFETWHLNCISNNEEQKETIVLQKLLRQARLLNIHFLREDCDIYVETVLEFDRFWGLGSSSTLIYNIAQWAYVSPFELQNQTFRGSGYDIACAQSMGPITYVKTKKGPNWETVEFNPHFKDKLFFIYLNKKQNSAESVRFYKELSIPNKTAIINEISGLSEALINCVNIYEFDEVIKRHEEIIASSLGLESVKKRLFNDYNLGEVKSLGAWGGDFVLATCSNGTYSEVLDYFQSKGLLFIFSFDDFIIQKFHDFSIPVEEKGVELSSEVVDGR